MIPRVPRARGPLWAEDPQVVELRALIAQAEADPAQAQGIAEQVLEAAFARLQAAGVQVQACESAGGKPAMQILPDVGSALGALAQFLHEQVDGFKLIYSPIKLLEEHTRGAVWGLRRQVAVAHDLVFEGQPDPITLHEVEHALLNVAEEQGHLHRWLGFMQSIDGNPLSNVAAEQGGYLTYCSIQEIPAYSAQVRALARRLEAAPQPGRDLDELESMARWGRALAGRLADVATRAEQHLEAQPENAIFETRHLVPAGRDPEQTPHVLWVSVDRPDVRVSFPLPGAPSAQAYAQMMGADPVAALQARAHLLAKTRGRLQDLRISAAGVQEDFCAVENAAAKARAQGDLPSIRTALRVALRLG